MSPLGRRLESLFHAGHAARELEVTQDGRLRGDETLHPAAVLIAMTEREHQPGFLLLHRPSHMRAHPGQVAFPGGRIDPGEDAISAALREANEELGIPVDAVRIIGPSDIYRSSSGYEITPVLGLIPPDLPINPNPNEVAQWFEAPVDFVLDPANQQRKWGTFGGDPVQYTEILWQEHRIWGVTAAIIVNLTQRLNWHG